MTKGTAARLATIVLASASVLVFYQNCTQQNMHAERTPASADAQDGLQMGGNGTGYDGKAVYVSRGLCQGDYFAIKSVVQMQGDGTAQVTMENCQSIQPRSVSATDLFLPPQNRNVLAFDGSVHAVEIERVLNLAGKTFVVPKAGAGGLDRLLFITGNRLHLGSLKDSFVSGGEVLKDASGAEFIYDERQMKLVTVAVLHGSPMPQLIFQKSRSLYRREMKDGVLSAPVKINKSSIIEIGFEDKYELDSDHQVVGAGDFLGRGYDQILLLEDDDRLQVIPFNNLHAEDETSLRVMFSNGYDTALVQRRNGSMRFLGMGKFDRGGKAAPFRRLSDVLEVPQGDSRITEAPANAGTPSSATVETRNKSILRLRESQEIVAIANLEGDERSEILFEENGSLQILFHAGEGQLGSRTVGNLVNP